MCFGPISHKQASKQANKTNQTNKLATEIGNSRMPLFPITLASDQQSPNGEEDEDKGDGDEEEVEAQVCYGQCVFECNIHHIDI